VKILNLFLSGKLSLGKLMVTGETSSLSLIRICLYLRRIFGSLWLFQPSSVNLGTGESL